MNGCQRRSDGPNSPPPGAAADEGQGSSALLGEMLRHIERWRAPAQGRRTMRTLVEGTGPWAWSPVQRRADGFCPVPDCGLWVITPNVFRLSVDSRRPELGQIDTYVCPRCDTHLVREGPGEPWRVLSSISEG